MSIGLYTVTYTVSVIASDESQAEERADAKLGIAPGFQFPDLNVTVQESEATKRDREDYYFDRADAAYERERESIHYP
jgi:hypothetical protein